MSFPQIRWPGRTLVHYSEIDLGDGVTIQVEDALDGHVQRLLRSRTVEVQTDDSLRSAITVIAPDLTPLTDLAEDLADAVPDVQPEAQFRSDLHRALELTHRQRTARRTLGTEPRFEDERHASGSWSIVVGILLLATITLLYWGTRRRVMRGAR